MVAETSAADLRSNSYSAVISEITTALMTNQDVKTSLVTKDDEAFMNKNESSHPAFSDGHLIVVLHCFNMRKIPCEVEWTENR